MTEELRIDRAAVIGAGVMGAAISAHLANAGIPNLLLDLDADLARRGFDRARKSKPASFYSAAASRLVEIGGLDRDRERLGEADWVVEAVVENLEVKRDLFAAILPHLRPEAVLTTNTSGLSVAALAGSLPPERRARFLVTHFFNPPRYLKLLELVPGPETSPAVLEGMAELGERRLGKGIVRAKDTPNFIANRIGVYAMLQVLSLALAEGYAFSEVDRLTGKAIGRPKSATFRTADLVGLDTLVHVARNMYENLPDDPERERFRPPELLEAMMARGWLGEKSGQGFYKKHRGDQGTEILVLDPERMEHVPQPKISLPSLEMARSIEDPGERIRQLVEAKDRAGGFLWKSLSATLLYAAASIPEASDDVVNVDRALRWGFGWELGPFETWDALGFRRACDRLAQEGRELPPIARKLLDSGGEGFYRTEGARRLFFDLAAGEHRELVESPRILRLADRKRAGQCVLDGPDASLVDLGDGVACLEFHTKMNTIGPGVIAFLEESLDRVEAGWKGLVIGNDAQNFSVGANLLLILNEIDDDNLDEVDWTVRRFQAVNQRIRFCRRPVVVAPHGLTLGGGCEMLLAADRVCAAAESYIGLVELGAGVIPAGGGCKEMVKRVHQSVAEGAAHELFPRIRRVFETIGMARVAGSADEARGLGYLRDSDAVSMNRDHLLHDAKVQVLALEGAGYRPGRPLDDIRVAGEPGLAALRAGLHNLAAGGQITEYDRVVGDRLAWVLCGGEIDASERVSERYLLDLERQAFLALCEDSRTLDRMEHILKTGKPLRN